MTDLISREAVCKIVADRVTDKFEKEAACHGIRALPSAQVDYCAEYYRGWNDAMGSIPKRVIDDPALSPTAVDASQMPDPVIDDPRVMALVEAVHPFDAAVFNDNGDVTVSTGSIKTAHWLRLSAALRAIGGEA